MEVVINNSNNLLLEDYPAHRWYRFVLSFPPHLVRQYLDCFNIRPNQVVLDPFCGTGTTLVECKKAGINSIGIEALPIAHFASSVKTDWSPDPEMLFHHSHKVSEIAFEKLSECGGDSLPLFDSNNGHLRRLPESKTKLLIKNSISELPLHKVMILIESINSLNDRTFLRHEQLALAKSLIRSIGNLKFGPEVGVGKIKEDVDVIDLWLSEVCTIVDDLKVLKNGKCGDSEVRYADSRELENILKPESIDAVITSPPYPNEKDYTRTTRLESVLLGFIEELSDLKRVKKSLLRSNTRNVYVNDRDDKYIEGIEDIQLVADMIERKRKELNKTSGFEKQYSRLTKLYFGGMYRHLASLRKALKPGALLAYVVGDQASYFRVMIRTGEIIAKIAQQLGYQLIDIDLFRTRFSTVTKTQLREEVVILKWQ
ncbi:MAG: DNA methyltransferase [Candidatus Hatepunaea meridiana]|nr:DNA methyltransferase [Candidatus Hatepunaea meridiana]